ncbi:MAG: DNA polymerase III subunit [Aquificaceae bacterium]|jgi:DNA polymerase-3 subunit delta'|uniref:DNA polymerase III subunit n=1 Tax=Hydrogenobacter sp. Uz 6-8 TaxID=3384828 RepID=UPI000F25E450|nr:MAG: DNA polymerase III subunit delta' [Aquificota bacterium]
MRERLKKFLSRLYHQKRVPASILFYGKEGVGKRDIAFEFATSLLCLKESYPPCGNCQSCVHMQDFRHRKEEELIFYGEDRKGKRVYLYLQGDHPDFVYLKPEKAEIKIDQIRGVKDFVYLKPALSKRKVVFVEPAESMNPQAQNALLKVLEEPPEDTHFLLVTSRLQKLLPTVRSRSFLLEVPPLSEEELREITGIQDPLILELSEGSLTMALKLKEDKELLTTAETILEGDLLSLYKKALEVEKWDYDRQSMLLKLLLNMLHMKYKQTRDEAFEQALDKASAGLEYLSKGIRLSLLLFQLRGGVKNVLHKGKISGHQQGASG